MGRKVQILLSSVFILSCLILCMCALPVNAESNPSLIPTLAPLLPAPPSNFNPLIATDQELQEYGFPSRPSDTVALAQWEYAMSKAKHYGKPVQTPATQGKHGQCGTYPSANWAGYVVNGVNNNNQTYKQVQAFWTQPAYSGNADPCFWAGIGGYNSSSLVQAGADCNATLFGGPTNYIFWVEDAPNYPCWESYPLVNPGNILFVQVTYQGTVSTAFLENCSTGQYTSAQFWTGDYDGTSVDYIHEAVNDIYSSWGSTSFTYCGYQTTQGVYSSLPNSNYIKVTMYNNLGYKEAWPSAVTSYNSSFTVTSK